MKTLVKHFLLFLFLQSMDVVMTVATVINKGNTFYEANPLAEAHINNNGIMGLIGVKIKLSFIVIAAMAIVYNRKRVETACKTMKGLNIFQFCIMLYSMFIFVVDPLIFPTMVFVLETISDIKHILS
jgi:hypothetical protein